MSYDLMVKRHSVNSVESKFDSFIIRVYVCIFKGLMKYLIKLNSSRFIIRISPFSF